MGRAAWRSRWVQLRLAATFDVAEQLERRCAELLSQHFRLLVLGLVGAYLLIQIRYIVGLPLVMDEFANARHIFRVAESVPYRDYVPYKTVLGYYLLLPGLVGLESSWWGMLAAKGEIAVLTSIVLAATSFRLRRRYAAPAILGALLLVCTQSTFLERSSELRVDMLSALFGVISLLAFLERRAVFAGVAATGAVLMTQKGAYFAISLGGASAWVILRSRQWAAFAEASRTALAAFGAFVAYVAFWCAIGSPRILWQSLFEAPRRIAFESLYDLGHFWTQTLSRNPIFYAVAVAGIALLIPIRRKPGDTISERHWAYSVIHVGLCLWHKQPWPYFFVMLIPTAWVLCAAALDRQSNRRSAWRAGVAGLVVVGSLVSLVQRVPAVLERSSVGQRRIVEAGEAFLVPGDTYLAGTELLWRHTHMAHLSWLDKPHVDGVRQEPEIPLRELRDAPPRLVIENYRVQVLPDAIREQLHQSFLPLGGNLWTYAPLLAEGASEKRYAHGGLYRVIAPPGGGVRVDGGPWLSPGDRVQLLAGLRQMRAVGGARLAAWSEAPQFVEQTSRPAIRFFDHVYTY